MLLFNSVLVELEHRGGGGRKVGQTDGSLNFRSESLIVHCGHQVEMYFMHLWSFFFTKLNILNLLNVFLFGVFTLRAAD